MFIVIIKVYNNLLQVNDEINIQQAVTVYVP